MTNNEAIRKLSLSLMQFGMLMPIEWVEANGEGSEFYMAMRMALDALEEIEHIRKENEQLKEHLTSVEKCDIMTLTDCDFCTNMREVLQENKRLKCQLSDALMDFRDYINKKSRSRCESCLYSGKEECRHGMFGVDCWEWRDTKIGENMVKNSETH